VTHLRVSNMKIDITKTALENIVLQVVEDNPGLILTADQVTLGAVSNFFGDPQNTQVTLTAIEGQGFSGSKVVKYKRLGVLSGKAVPVTSITISATDGFAEAQIAAAEAMGLRWEELLFHDWSPPVNVNVSGIMGVSPKAGGYFYVGAGEMIQVNMSADLETQIATDELSGFDPEV